MSLGLDFGGGAMPPTFERGGTAAPLPSRFRRLCKILPTIFGVRYLESGSYYVNIPVVHCTKKHGKLQILHYSIC